MEQSMNEVDQEQQQNSVMDVDETLSTKTRMQRERTGNTGAFGRRTGHSDLLFLEGILPTVDDNILNTHSIEEQTSVVLDNLESVLADRRNKTLDDIMKVEVHLTDPETAPAVDHVYESRFDGVELPPRTVVGVCSLPGGADIQLDVIATDE